MRTSTQGAVHPSGRIYAGDLSRTTQVFELTGDSLRYGDTFELPIAPTDLCLLGDSLVVHGVNLRVKELLHVLDPDGRHVRSFGRVYDSENPGVKHQISKGEIVCLPEKKLIVYAPGGVISEIRAYTPVGEVEWITTVEAYQPVDLCGRAGAGVEGRDSRGGRRRRRGRPTFRR